MCLFTVVVVVFGWIISIWLLFFAVLCCAMLWPGLTLVSALCDADAVSPMPTPWGLMRTHSPYMGHAAASISLFTAIYQIVSSLQHCCCCCPSINLLSPLRFYWPLCSFFFFFFFFFSATAGFIRVPVSFNRELLWGFL